MIQDRIAWLQWLDDKYSPASIVEVGTWRGEFAREILKNTGVKKLVCVDPWNGDGMGQVFDGDNIMKDAQQRLSHYPGRVEIIRTTSTAAASEFKRNSIDMVYIDADHRYDAVYADCQAWINVVRNGGVIAGHDYNNRGWKNVRSAVDCFFKGFTVRHTDERCPTWWVEL